MYLLDTNVISETRRPRPDPLAAEWLRGVPDRSMFVSVLTLGEIRKGIENARRRDRSKADGLDRWLNELSDRYAQRILPVTAEIAEAWGRVSSPSPVPVIDGLLAATAMVHELTVVTRNLKDFERSGVRVIDPFREPSR